MQVASSNLVLVSEHLSKINLVQHVSNEYVSDACGRSRG